MNVKKMALKWKKEDTEMLISSIEQYPCLYNIRSAEYLDRTKKAQAFNSILEVMRNTMSNISLEDIKQKWRNVRTQFVQEQRMIQNSKKSGCGISDIYVPRLWCFSQLSFLKTNTRMRQSEDNVKENDEENLRYDLTTESESLTEEPPQKRKRVPDVKELRNDLVSLKTTLLGRKNEKKFAWLGVLVVSQMEQVDPDEQDNAAWQVQCLMRKLISKKKQGNCACSSSSCKDILELSMEGIFEENDID